MTNSCAEKIPPSSFGWRVFLDHSIYMKKLSAFYAISAFSLFPATLLRMHQIDEFAGDKKVGKSVLERYEHKLKKALVPLIPSWLQTNHLTLLTIIWSALILVCGYSAQWSMNWFWVISALIVCQYITDLLDGEVGRVRKTGLIRWGYYMDHFLDYIFLCSLLVSYMFIFPTDLIYPLFFLLVMFSSFMVNSFLSFAVTNKLRISYLGIGPTEIRLGFIVVNSLLALFGKTHLRSTLPIILAFAFLGLVITIYRTQQTLWEADKKKLHVRAK